jgi:hypothetical protein
MFCLCSTCLCTGLALEPLSGALAAGNAVVVKPSELAPATSAFLAANIPKYLDSKAVKVVEGGPEVGEKLMEHRWDKVLFTGNELYVMHERVCDEGSLSALPPVIDVQTGHPAWTRPEPVSARYE